MLEGAVGCGERQVVGAPGLVVGRRLEAQRAAREVETACVRAAQGERRCFAFGVRGAVARDRAGRVLGEADRGRAVDRRGLVHVLHGDRDVQLPVAGGVGGPDGHFVDAVSVGILGILIVQVNVRAERQGEVPRVAGDKRLVHDETVGVRPRQREGDRIPFTVAGCVNAQVDRDLAVALQGHPLRLAVLRPEVRRVVGVGDRDRHGQRAAQAVGGRLDRHLVDVVRVGVRRRLEVRRRGEAQRSARTDAEVVGVRALDRPRDRVVLRVGRRVGRHRRRAVLGVAVRRAAARDARRFVLVDDVHGVTHRHGRVVGGRGLDDQFIGVVAVGVLRRIEVGGVGDAQHAPADREESAVRAGHTPGDGLAFGIAGRDRGEAPGDALGQVKLGVRARELRRLVDVGHGHGHRRAGGFVVRRRRHSDGVGALGLVVGRRLEGQRARAADVERITVGALDSPANAVPVGVGRGVGRHRAGRVLGEAGIAGAARDRRRVVRIEDLDRDGQSVVLVVGRGLDRDRVRALRLVVRRRLEPQAAEAVDLEGARVRAFDRPADLVELRVLGQVARDPKRQGVLGEAGSRSSIGDLRRFVHVCDRDVNIQRGGIAVVVRGAEVHQVVAVVLEVGGLLELEDSIGEGEAVGVAAPETQTDVAALGIHRRIGAHGCSRVLVEVQHGRAADDRRFVHVEHRERDVAAIALFVGRRPDRDRVRALRLVVRPLGQRKLAVLDREVRGVGSLHRPGDRVALRVMSRVVADHQVGRVLPDLQVRFALGDRRFLVHVFDEDRHVEVRPVAVLVLGVEGHVVGILGLVVGRVVEVELPVGEGEGVGIAAAEAQGRGGALRVRGAVRGHHGGGVLVEVHRGRTRDLRAFVHVGDRHAHGPRVALAVGRRLDRDRVGTLGLIVRRGRQRQIAGSVDREVVAVGAFQRPGDLVILGILGGVVADLQVAVVLL